LPGVTTSEPNLALDIAHFINIRFERTSAVISFETIDGRLVDLQMSHQTLQEIAEEIESRDQRL
jgi:hypothetical protein